MKTCPAGEGLRGDRSEERQSRAEEVPWRAVEAVEVTSGGRTGK